MPDLPEAQVAVLRRLAATGPISPSQLAAELQLARPTVSILVRDLTAEGLLKRQPSAVDGRSVVLVPTARAEGIHETFNRARVDVMTRALNEIPAEDRERLLAALPALTRLQQHLHATTEARADQRKRERPHG